MEGNPLTDTDAQLLTALICDRGDDLTTVAEILGVPVPTVQNRLRSLEAKGIITGYMPRLNYSMLGFDVTAIFEFEIAANMVSEMTSDLKNDSRVVTVYRITGSHDIVAIGKYEDTTKMNEQVQDFMANSKIERVDTSVVFETISEFEPIQFRSLDTL